MFYLIKSPFEGGTRRILSVVGRGMLLLVLAIVSLHIFPTPLTAQDFTQTIERSAQFENAGDAASKLSVYNIQGNVTIEGYSGDEIQITALQKIEGSGNDIERAKNDLQFIVDREGDNVYVYIDAPFITVKKERNRIHYRVDSRDVDYTFRHDITIRIPRNAHIYASTINKGTVTVRNTTGSVSAFNVNGEITLSNIAGTTKAHTVNGDIDIAYAQSPAQDSDYQTVNGTIDVRYPANLSADIRFKSLHGELYTDFENVERLQARVETDKRQKKNGVRYKIDRFSPLRIGNGGPTFSFEVLNGDVYIKRIQS